MSHLDLTQAVTDASTDGSGASPLSGDASRHPKSTHFVQDGRMAEAGTEGSGKKRGVGAEEGDLGREGGSGVTRKDSQWDSSDCSFPGTHPVVLQAHQCRRMTLVARTSPQPSGIRLPPSVRFRTSAGHTSRVTECKRGHAMYPDSLPTTNLTTADLPTHSQAGCELWQTPTY